MSDEKLEVMRALACQIVVVVHNPSLVTPPLRGSSAIGKAQRRNSFTYT